jgi:2,3-bisphosphoglycerate-dependent phosphoglycerate mutase
VDTVIRVWLIRHGESESNAGLPSGEPGASPLTALGQWQAEQVAGAFAQAPALIVTSPYLRSQQTAQPTASRFPRAQREEWLVHEFTYLGHLRSRSMTSTERRPHVREYWERSDPDEINGGAESGAESFAQLIGRARDLLGRLSEGSSGPVAVFTHGIFMRAVAWSLVSGITVPTAADMQSFIRFSAGYRTPNGGVIELRHRPGWRGPVLMGASTLHLPDPPPPVG